MYQVSLSINIRKEVQNGSAEGALAFILLDKKGGIMARVATLSHAVGGDGIPAGNAHMSTKVPTKYFEDASGYAMIVKEGKDNYPAFDYEFPEFLKKEVPSWKEAVDAYKESKGGDKSKSFGPALVRRLK